MVLTKNKMSKKDIKFVVSLYEKTEEKNSDLASKLNQSAHGSNDRMITTNMLIFRWLIIFSAFVLFIIP